MSDVTITFGGDATVLNQAINQIKQTVTTQLSQMKQQIVSNSGTIQNSFNSISQNSQIISASLKQFAFGAYSAFAIAQSGIHLFSGSFSTLKSAIAAAGDIESIRLNYIQFCGDAEKADRLIEQLRDKSVKSPYETNDLLKSGNALLSAGIEADRVFGIVSSIAAVSGGNGQVLSELSLSMSKGFARQKFQTEQVMAFAQRGINILPELAAVTGKVGTELNKAIEKGLSFDLVTKALERLTQKGGQYYGLMEKQGDSWNGLMSTMTGGISELMVAFAEPIKDGLKPYLIQINSIIGELMPIARELGGKLIEAFSASIPIIMSVVNCLRSIVTGTDTVSMTVRDLIVTFVLLRLGVDKAVMSMGHAIMMKLGGSLAAIKLQAAVTGGSFATLRAGVTLSFASMASAVRGAASVMAASFKGAIIAMKGALVSTGIGAALVLLGEAAAYIYEKIMESSNAAKAVQERAADLEMTKRKESREIDLINEESSMISKRQQLEERIQELRDSLMVGKVELSVDAIQGVQDEIMAYEDLLRKLNNQVPGRIAAAEATRKQREETARLKQKLEEEQEQQKKNAEEIDKLIQKRDEEREKKMVDKLNLDQKTNYALTIANVTGLDELEAKIDRIKTRAAETGMVSDYDKQSLETLLRSRDLLDDIAEKRKESNETMYKEVESYSMRISLIQAELDGNTKRIRYLKEQQKIMEEMDKFRKAGFSDAAAEKMAKEIVKLEASKEKNSNIESEVERYNGTTADSKSRVGGGGIGFTISVQPLLTESRKQTNVLEKIREYLPKLEAKQQSASAGTIGP